MSYRKNEKLMCMGKKYKKKSGKEEIMSFFAGKNESTREGEQNVQYIPVSAHSWLTQKFNTLYLFVYEKIQHYMAHFCASVHVALHKANKKDFL